MLQSGSMAHYILGIDSERQSSQQAKKADGEPIVLVWQQFLDLIPIDPAGAAGKAGSVPAGRGGGAKNAHGTGAGATGNDGGGITSTNNKTSQLRRAAHQHQHDQQGAPPPQFNEGKSLLSPQTTDNNGSSNSPLSLKRKRTGGLHNSSDGSSESNRACLEN